MKSIIHEKDGTCYLCQKLLKQDHTYKYTEEHHVFGGKANRKLSEKYGLKVHLCVWHHREGPMAVHKNAGVSEGLKRDAQEIFEQTHTREEFREIFGKSWLYDDPDEELDAFYQEKEQRQKELEEAAGFQMLPGEDALEGMGRKYLEIEKAAAARKLNEIQFRNLLEIAQALN